MMYYEEKIGVTTVAFRCRDSTVRMNNCGDWCGFFLAERRKKRFSCAICMSNVSDARECSQWTPEGASRPIAFCHGCVFDAALARHAKLGNVRIGQDAAAISDDETRHQRTRKRRRQCETET
jgi:hypothetical protein